MNEPTPLRGTVDLALLSPVRTVGAPGGATGAETARAVPTTFTVAASRTRLPRGRLPRRFAPRTARAARRRAAEVRAAAVPDAGTAVSLPGRPESVGRARRHVAAVLEGLELGHLVDVAVLLTSEVATNAVEHACGGADFTVRVRLEAARVWIEVTDPDCRSLSAGPAPSLDSDNGRGLWLIGDLAECWETVPDADGKTVRFALRAGRSAATLPGTGSGASGPRAEAPGPGRVSAVVAQ